MIYYRNGKFGEDNVGQDISQPSFRTGYGFFETICWNGRKICHLDLHLERARKSLADFRVVEEAVDYAQIILEVIQANSLEEKFARVNIFFPVENGRSVPVICAVPFEHMPEREWKLQPAADVFLSDLMRHKTMNRMDYLNAWQKACESGFDDALLVDFDRNVLESSFAALLFQKGDIYYEPETRFKLSGTAQKIASGILPIEPAVINLDSVTTYEHAFALNSLGGMIPISAVGTHGFECCHETAGKISRSILEL